MVLWWIRFWFWDLRTLVFSGEPARVHASLVGGLCVTMVTVNEHNNGKNGSSAGFGPVAPDISLIWSSADGFLCRPMMSQFTLFKVRTCYFRLNVPAGSKFGSEPCQCGTTMSGLWSRKFHQTWTTWNVGAMRRGRMTVRLTAVKWHLICFLVRISLWWWTTSRHLDPPWRTSRL